MAMARIESTPCYGLPAGRRQLYSENSLENAAVHVELVPEVEKLVVNVQYYAVCASVASETARLSQGCVEGKAQSSAFPLLLLA